MSSKGHTDIGFTLAIVLIGIGAVLAEKYGFSGWPWWGKALAILAAIIVFFAGGSFEESRRWPVVDLDATPAKDDAAKTTDEK